MAASLKGQTKQAVEALLGHTFRDAGALERALTHGSHASGHTDTGGTYQQLEFLGDRVLALVIADALTERFNNWAAQ